MITMTEEQLVDYVNSLESEYKSLSELHQGVRPGWVSSELSWLSIRLSDAKQDLQDMQEHKRKQKRKHTRKHKRKVEAHG